ncbi:MAG: polysaccharide pyruvyl transferase family protein [Bacteroidales bacterium]
MKILILTQPLHTNYGGLLQAYALQKVLKDMGHDVTTDKNTKTFNKPPFLAHRLPRILVKSVLGGIFRIKRFLPVVPKYLTEQDYKIIAQHTERFIENNINTTVFASRSENFIDQKQIPNYEAFVVGSDQVWRKAYSNIGTYFLDFLKDSKAIKISYAASFGKDDIDEYTEEERKLCKELAPKFNGISVREDSGVEICSKEFGAKAEHHLDPTMLLDKEDYLKLIEEEEEKTEQQNILKCYVLDKSEDKQNIINQIAKAKGLNPLKIMPKENFNPNKKQETEEYICPAVSKWIAGFRDAQFVVTDSFHGTVFAIIFNKPFVAIANKDRGASRFTSLLKMFGLEDRLIYKHTDLTDELINKPIDFAKLNALREKHKQTAFAYLKNNLSES